MNLNISYPILAGSCENLDFFKQVRLEGNLTLEGVISNLQKTLNQRDIIYARLVREVCDTNIDTYDVWFVKGEDTGTIARKLVKLHTERIVNA